MFKYFLAIASLVFLSACGISQFDELSEEVIQKVYEEHDYDTHGHDGSLNLPIEDETSFIINPTIDNLQGIWTAWNEDGNFEFFDIMEDIIVHGEIAPNGEVLFLNVASFHFHGYNAHALFNFTLNSAGSIEETHIDVFFAALLNVNEDVVRVTFLEDERTIYLSNSGHDPIVIDEAIGVLFFGNYTAYEMIESLLWAFVFPAEFR